jgi:hypothetical protein
MRTATKRTGFSLVEVVLAVGIFAVAVTVMLALLPSLTRQNTETADAFVAQRLPDSLRVELQRLAANDFGALAATIPLMAAPLDNGLLFVASRDGARLHSADYLPPAGSRRLPLEQRYFAIEAWRFNQGTLQYDGAGPVLAVWVRISWPYCNPGSPAPTPPADRSQFTFAISLRR